MPELNFSLHPAQKAIFEHPARFKVVAAGRRWGKTHLARVMLAVNALLNEDDEGRSLKDRHVAYVAPTQQMARDLMWSGLKDVFAPFAPRTRENEGIMILPNGREVHLRGADRPDNLRGRSYHFIVLDEYAQMKPIVWTAILRPSLADAEGKALFIGTPQGKNHFYDLFIKAAKPLMHDWGAWTYPSIDNPFLKQDEIEAAKLDMPIEYARQEFEADFRSFGGAVFTDEMIIERTTPIPDNEVVIACDLSGFDPKKKDHGKTLDDSAFAAVETGREGWRVRDIMYGRWDVRETAIRLLRFAQNHRPRVIGIEKGALMQALMPYLQDNMKRLGTFPAITAVSHTGKNKAARIEWALAGRLQQGRLFFAPGGYLKKLREQLVDFPNPLAHDDLIDALAYVDQLAAVSYHDDVAEDTFEPLDSLAGF